MKNLISLEQIVKNQKELYANGKISETETLLNIFNSVEALEQPPQLNHFVPAVLKDGNWRVLEKPKNNSYLGGRGAIDAMKLLQHEKDLAEYETALKDVIFSDWEVVDHSQNQTFRTKSICYKGFLNAFWWHKETGLWELSKGISTYSDLTKYNLPLNEKGCEKFNL